MKYNGWQARLLFGLALWAANMGHHKLVADCANTPEAMFFYHFSAAVVDGFLLWCASSCLKGRLCDDIETLCLASMVVNFLAFLAYMAYMPPVMCNYAILTLGYMQYARLLWAGNYDADLFGRDVFWRHHLARS